MATLTWNDLFLSGSIVNLTVARWPARVRIRPEDLGIEDSTEVDRALALGCHRLLPGDAFANIDLAARQAKKAIDGLSLPFGLLWGARYVPEANLTKLGEKLKGCRQLFYGAVDAFMENYVPAQEQMLPVIKKALQDAARTPEAAELAFSRVANEYPPEAVVRARFALNWAVYSIAGPRSAGIAASLKDEGAEVKGAISEMMRSLRGEVTEKLSEVIGLINKGGKLGERSIEAALKTLDHVDAVNVLGDDDLRDQVRKLRDAINTIKTGERIPDATVTGLSQIKVALEQDIEAAVAAAEERLTGMGRRKLQVA